MLIEAGNNVIVASQLSQCQLCKQLIIILDLGTGTNDIDLSRFSVLGALWFISERFSNQTPDLSRRIVVFQIYEGSDDM